jgi:hypothetical protein
LLVGDRIATKRGQGPLQDRRTSAMPVYDQRREPVEQ